MTGRQRLLRTADKMQLLIRENPCGWGDTAFGAIAEGIDMLLGEKTKNGVTLIDMAEYYHVTIRTIERWRIRYNDFPTPLDPYAKTLAFPTDDVVEWKQRHAELF